MMRKLVAALVVLAAVGAAVFATGASEESGAPSYWIKFDNAFGLVDDADLKVAGVRAGKVKELELDRSDMRARVRVEIEETGFGDLREDASCEARPQSLIGEYFVDCVPGKSPRKLEDGDELPTIGVGTVPVDLVNNIMRRPYRERLSIIYNELGAGLAARGDDLNETIRRASPALREVNRVLAILRDHRTTIRDLYRDADRVVGELADNRTEVTRFVREARDTARVSAERTRFVRANFQRLPRFFRELTPTLKVLGESSVRQEGALRNLNRYSGLLKRFIDRLGPFAEASRPAVRSLGEAAEQGRPAAKAALPRLEELRQVGVELPEAAQNLAITLEHLDDRKWAVEKDPRSPGGEGYTGIESLLRYVFAQSQAINLFDASSYILKVSAFLDRDCAAYFNAEMAKRALGTPLERCAARLGPNQPGITVPDPTATTETRAKAKRKAKAKDAPAAAPQAPAATPQEPGKPAPGAGLPKLTLPDEVQELLDKILPGGTDPGAVNDILGAGSKDDQNGRLLDFLLAP